MQAPEKFTLDPNVWEFARQAVFAGDRLGVFQNSDLGHSELGHIVLVKVGPQYTWKKDSDVPERLPDGVAGIGIAWRYWKKGIYGKAEFSRVFVLDGQTTEENDTKKTPQAQTPQSGESDDPQEE